MMPPPRPARRWNCLRLNRLCAKRPSHSRAGSVRGRLDVRTPLRILAALWLTAALAGLPAGSRADDYPNRPITLIVPFPPGGSTTVMARNVADKMSEALGQPIVVENRGGAGGTIGTRYAAKAAPDGYTILLSYTGTFSIAPTAYANAGYDPRKDFAPIGMIGAAPNLLLVTK